MVTDKTRKQVPKTLTARSDAELEQLKRLGWVVKE